MDQLCTHERVTAASAPDVRRRLCLAVSASDAFGCAARTAFGPQTRGEARTGEEAASQIQLPGGAKPSPHITRQSRYE